MRATSARMAGVVSIGLRSRRMFIGQAERNAENDETISELIAIALLRSLWFSGQSMASGCLRAT